MVIDAFSWPTCLPFRNQGEGLRTLAGAHSLRNGQSAGGLTGRRKESLALAADTQQLGCFGKWVPGPRPCPHPTLTPRGHAACCGPRGLSPPPPRPAFSFLELGSQTHCPGGQPVPLKTSLQCLQESDVLGKIFQEAKASARSGFSQMGSSAFPCGEDLVFRAKEESVWLKKRQKRGCTFGTLHWKRP